MTYELTRNCTAYKFRIFLLAQFNILLNLRYSDFVCTTFSLNRDDKLAASLIDPHINLIRFNLPNTFYSCAQMILEGIACNP